MNDRNTHDDHKHGLQFDLAVMEARMRERRRALATLNFAVGLDQPAGAIWDESYYLTSVQRYRDHTAQFASHPPLGLMLITAVGGRKRCGVHFAHL